MLSAPRPLSFPKHSFFDRCPEGCQDALQWAVSDNRWGSKGGLDTWFGVPVGFSDLEREFGRSLRGA